MESKVVFNSSFLEFKAFISSSKELIFLPILKISSFKFKTLFKVASLLLNFDLVYLRLIPLLNYLVYLLLMWLYPYLF